MEQLVVSGLKKIHEGIIAAQATLTLRNVALLEARAEGSAPRKGDFVAVKNAQHVFFGKVNLVCGIWYYVEVA